MVAGFDAEFVVATPQILDERVAADHGRRSPIHQKTAHRAEPSFEPAVVAFDRVLRVLRRVIRSLGEKVVDDARQR